MKQMLAPSARAATTITTSAATIDAIDVDLSSHEALSQPGCPYVFVQLVANPRSGKLR